jgi:hypothetical protein
MAHALACGLLALPLGAGLALRRKPHFWEKLALYDKLDEYGEPQAWKASSIKTPVNSWSSLAYFAVGVYLAVWPSTEQLGYETCLGAVPHWRFVFVIACCWTGIASFCFHASLTERWRVLDAGAGHPLLCHTRHVLSPIHRPPRAAGSTMGIPCITTGYSLHRSLTFSISPLLCAGRPCGSWTYAATWVSCLRQAVFPASLLGFVGVHLLARRRGWSNTVLPVLLLGQARLGGHSCTY